jgi:hypothetical protein
LEAQRDLFKSLLKQKIYGITNFNENYDNKFEINQGKHCTKHD